nr:hypothetical protein CFP56_33431 [Quercus suber]
MSSAPSSSVPEFSRRRRNGRKASCEPCRKAKIRCDHQTPRCGQCVRLGKGTECFVHNAPMTSRRGPPDWNSHARPLDPQAGAWGGHGVYSSVNSAEEGHSRGITHAQIMYAEDVTQRSRTQQVAAILLTLSQHVATVKLALETYYRGASAALVPGTVTMAIVDSLPESFARLGIDMTEGGQLRARRSAVEILDATAATPWKPSITTTVSEFVSMWSGSKIRLQALGLVCGMAGRSMLYELADCTEGRPQNEIIQTMLRLSTWCLAIVREVAPAVTDVQIWHAFENLHLYTALNTYRRECDQWYSLDLLSNSPIQTLPFRCKWVS